MRVLIACEYSGRTRQNTGKRWTQEEIEMLEKIFPTTRTADLEPIFSCSYAVIKRTARTLGIKKDPVWLKKTRSENSIAILKLGPNRGFKKGVKPWNYGKRKYDEDEHPRNGVTDHKDSRPRKGSVFTGHGYQNIQEVPGGRIITHKISDVSVRMR